MIKSFIKCTSLLNLKKYKFSYLLLGYIGFFLCIQIRQKDNKFWSFLPSILWISKYLFVFHSLANNFLAFLFSTFAWLLHFLIQLSREKEKALEIQEQLIEQEISKVVGWLNILFMCSTNEVNSFSFIIITLSR